jgi:hypothetical protein
MPRLRNALTVAAAGLALSLLGAGTAAATPNTHCPPPDSECSSTDTDMGGCAGGLDVGGVLDLGGLLDGLLGGLVGGGGACCTAADPA